MQPQSTDRPYRTGRNFKKGAIFVKSTYKPFLKMFLFEFLTKNREYIFCAISPAFSRWLSGLCGHLKEHKNVFHFNITFQTNLG